MTCDDATIRKVTNRAVKCIRDEGHGGAHKYLDEANRIVLLWFRDHEEQEGAA